MLSNLTDDKIDLILHHSAVTCVPTVSRCRSITVSLLPMELEAFVDTAEVRVMMSFRFSTGPSQLRAVMNGLQRSIRVALVHLRKASVR